MKKYEKPNAELTFFTVEEILEPSPLPPSCPTLEGTAKDLYEVYAAADGSSALANVFVDQW